MFYIVARLATDLAIETTLLTVRYTARGVYYALGALYKAYNRTEAEQTLEEKVDDLQQEMLVLRTAQQHRQTQLSTSRSKNALRSSV